jgi:hypothetical protein
MKMDFPGQRSDNDNQPGRIEARDLADRQADIEATALQLSGRADLLDLALATRKRLLQIEGAMEDLNRRKKESASHAEQALLHRALAGSMFQHRSSTDRFRAIEIAMEPATRLALWRYLDADVDPKR